jgi:CMP-N,N'-diacetyllegionaminic acid synthase
MTVWGLVPARGGSKSIPLKNLASLAGRPLLDYVVRAGQKSGALARMICSTDHDAIAAHARDLGA